MVRENREKQGEMRKKRGESGKNSHQHPLLLLSEPSKPQIVTLQHHPTPSELHLCPWAHPSSLLSPARRIIPNILEQNRDRPM